MGLFRVSVYKTIVYGAFLMWGLLRHLVHFLLSDRRKLIGKWANWPDFSLQELH